MNRLLNLGGISPWLWLSAMAMLVSRRGKPRRLFSRLFGNQASVPSRELERGEIRPVTPISVVCEESLCHRPRVEDPFLRTGGTDCVIHRTTHMGPLRRRG